MTKYGANAWRVSNYLTEKEVERLQAQLDVVKRKTEEVNRERKSKQVSDTGILLPFFKDCA